MRSHVLGTVALAGLAFPLSNAASAQEESPAFCETGYVAVVEDDDGVLDTAEVDALRAAEFGALDADADGTVTAEEITACTTAAGQRNFAPRNVGAEADDLPPVELEALEDGTLTRQEYMEAAELAFDATRNEEENAIQWARNFVLLTDEGETEIRSMSRQEFAARSSALFQRLDVDGNDQLSTEEWQAETPPASSAATETALTRADADQSGDITRDEYAAAGIAQADRGRQAALARGWGEEGTQAGGVESADEPSAEGDAAQGLVTTDSPRTMIESGEGVPVFDYYFDRGE